MDPDKVLEVWHRRNAGNGHTIDEEVAVHTPSGVPITWRSLSLLHGTRWLDDELINGYLELVQTRNDEAVRPGNQKTWNVQVFNTFWWTKITRNGNGYDYQGIKRWSRKVELLDKDMILVPINHSNLHWTLACINLVEKRIEYYDSVKGRGLSGRSGKRVLSVLKRFLKHEIQERGSSMLLDNFTKSIVQNIPTQQDAGSCGVFTCLYAERLSRGVRPPFNFTHADIPRLRTCMAADILQNEIKYSSN